MVEDSRPPSDHPGMIRPAFFLSVLLVCAAGCANAQESATTNRVTELRAEPQIDAPVLAALPEGKNVKAIQRQSGWAKIEADQKTGWVRVFHLRFQATVSQTSEGSGSSLLSFFKSKPRGPSTQTATIGVRGLSEEELKSATPNPEALKKLQTFMADRSGSESFAREANLAAVRVDYVDGESSSAAKGSRK